MSGSATVAQVYSAIEEASGLLDVPCDRERVWPILSAYEEAIPNAVIVCSMATGESGDGELDYTVTVPAGEGDDPYAVALAEGFADATDHPVGVLLQQAKEHSAIAGYAIDCGVVGGFKKTYAFFPLTDLAQVAKLTQLPAMPPALAANAERLAAHGLADNVTMLGVDYKHHTVNVYFGRLPDGALTPEWILDLLRSLGLPDPTGQMVEFAANAFAVYITMNWDALEIERICFAVITPDQNALPSRIDPEIAHFARNAPHSNDGDRILVYGITVAPGGEYCKLGAYWQMAAETRRQLMAFQAIKDQV